MLIRIMAGAAIAAVLTGASAEAATQAEWNQCREINNQANAQRNIAVCTRILNDRRSSVRDRADALTNRCALYELVAEPDRAIEDCNQSLKLRPRDGVTHNNRGTALMHKGDFDRALTDFNEAIRFSPKDGIIRDNRGRAWFFKGDFQRSVADHTEAIRLRPKDDVSFSNRARSHLYGGSTARALADMNQALKLKPNDHYHALWVDIIGHRNNVPSRLAAASLDTNRWPGPIVRLFLGQLSPAAVLAAADDANPIRRRERVCDAHFFGGQWELQRGDNKEAARRFQNAIAECPVYLGTWRAAREEQRILGSIVVVQQGKGGPESKSDQQATIDYLGRGNDWRSKGELDRAIADFTEAIRVNPKDARAYDARGSAWQAKGDFDRAIADFTEAIRLNPNYADAYINRGTSFDDRGELDRAIDDFSQAIRLDPKRAPTHYLRGYVLHKKAELDRAIVDFTEAIRLDPNYARAYYSRGVAQHAKGEYHRAVADLTDAIRLAPKDATAHYLRGRAQLYNGSAAQALADLNQAGELDPKDHYHALWVDIAGHRNNAPSRLAKAIAFLDMTRWPAPVIRLFLGQSAPSAVLAAASDPNPRRRLEQICEAHFYSGQWTLRQGNRQEAVRLLRMAANDCPRNVIDWGAVRAELRALGETP